MTAVAESHSSRWWIPLLQGILSIIVGIMFLMKPIATSATAVLVLGIYWLIIGGFDLISLIWNRTAWGWKLFTGIIGILAGGLIVSSYFGNSAMPLVDVLGTTAAVGLALSVVLGILGILYGIFALIGAFTGGGWVAGVLGALGVVFGLIILFNPALVALGLPFVIGIWLLVSGVFLIISAFRLR
ncbi:MAG: DUF308 domain-containing protein [Chloroflexota bacterium]|nr:DUF308 domain-containing protein [Chloroflexota bacterium]